MPVICKNRLPFMNRSCKILCCMNSMFGIHYTNVYKLSLLYYMLPLVGDQTAALTTGWFELVKEREHLRWLELNKIQSCQFVDLDANKMPNILNHQSPTFWVNWFVDKMLIQKEKLWL